MRDLFSENLRWLRRIDPILAGKVEKGLSILREIEVLNTKTRTPTLRMRGILLHSLYDPEKEAIRLIERHNLDKELFIILGFGLGYHVLELAKRVKGKILIIEPQLPILRTAMRVVDFSKILGHKEIAFLVPDSIEELVESLNDEAILASDYELIEHHPSIKISSIFFRFANAILSGNRTHLKRRSLLPLDDDDFIQLLIESILTKNWPKGGFWLHRIITVPRDHYRHILLIQLASIGDVVYTTPVFLGLKERFKDARLSFMTETPHAELVMNDPNLDEVIPFPKRRFLELTLEGRIDEARDELMGFVQGLRERRFDLLINLHTSPRSAILTRLAHGKEVWGLSLDEKGRVVLSGNEWMHYRYISANKGDMGGLGVVELHLLSSGVDPSRRETIIYVDDEVRKRANAILRSNNVKRDEKMVALCPGSNYPSRRWPKENFARLGGLIHRRYGAKILILGGEDDIERGKWIADSMEGEVVNLCGKTSLLELASILSRCELLITNDTGPLHIASAMKIPTVTIAGPAWIGPYGPGHLLLVARLPCIGCSKYRCDHHTCMQAITPDMVLLGVEILMRIQRKESIGELLNLPFLRDVEVMYSGNGSPSKLFSLSPLKRIEGKPELVKRDILRYARLNIIEREGIGLCFSPRMIMDRINQEFCLIQREDLIDLLLKTHNDLVEAREICQRIMERSKDGGRTEEDMKKGMIERLRRLGIDDMVDYLDLSLQEMEWEGGRYQFYSLQLRALIRITITIEGIIEILRGSFPECSG